MSAAPSRDLGLMAPRESASTPTPPSRGPRSAIPRVPRTPLDRLAARWRASTATLWAVALVMGLFELLIATRVLIIQPRADIRPLLGLALLVAAALLGRRRRPLAAVILTGLVCAGVGLWGPQDATFTIPPLVALYSLCVIAGTAQRIIGLLVVFACWTLPPVATSLASPLIGWITPEILLLAVVVTAAATSRSRREALEHGDALLAAQAAEHRLMAQRDAARHQARVAAELHDSVGHDLTAIIALSEGLAGAAGDAELDDAIAAINALAREGLADTRHTVDALQPDAGPVIGTALAEKPAAGPGPAEPRRGWDDLDGVLETTRRTGLAVALAETGPRPEDAALGGVVFTVVREALTNAMRHAEGATRVIIALEHAEGSTGVTVSDDGRNVREAGFATDGAMPVEPTMRAPVEPVGTPSPGAPPSGHGLAHLADAVRGAGGALSAGPAPDGWRLHAVIPHREAA